MIYYLLLDRKERYPSYEDEDLPPRNDVGQSLGGRRDPLKRGRYSYQSETHFTDFFKSGAPVCSVLLPVN